MKVRGERECRKCGTRWSYFETGSVACPACGSVRSSGRNDRHEHTAGGTALDVTPATEAVDEEPIGRVAELAAEAGRAYRREAGFVEAGELQPLGDTFLLAAELETVGRHVSQAMQVGENARTYLLALIRAPPEDDRPDPGNVPSSLAPARGLAVCRAVDAYVGDLKLIYDEPDRPLARCLSVIRTRRKRIEALDGDVEPRHAEQLVEAARDLYEYLARDDEPALARIDERLP